MKRLITLLLSVLLVVSTLPVMSFTALAADDENLALGRPAFTEGAREGYRDEAINDGDLGTGWAGLAGYNRAWVAVDLEEEYIITEVVLHNQVGTAEQYRRAVDIELSNTPDFAVKEVYKAMGVNVGDEAPDGVPVRVPITSLKQYRYVRAVKTNGTTHIVQDLEVYGYKYDPNALRVGKDVAGTKLEGPVMMLSYLKLIDLEKPIEEIFGVNSVMTRSEGVAAVVKAFAGNVSFNGWIPFNDVTSATVGYDSIATAYNMGYITGEPDTSFRPREYTTVAELLAMTLRAMGYQDVSEHLYDHDIAKIIKRADELDLLKDTGITDYSAFVTRGEMAQIFYNAMIAPGFKLQMTHQDFLVFDEAADILSRQHGMMLTKGIAEETRVSTIDGTKKVNKNSASIGGKYFVDPEGKLDAFLGKEVIVMSSEADPEKVLIAWTTDKNEEVVLPANDLLSTKADIDAGKVVAIDENGNDEVYDLANKFNVIINDVAYPYYEAADLMPTSGQLRLLDNDRDGVYDVVFVESYTLHYLKNGFNDAASVTIVDSNGLRQSFDVDTLTITDGNGNSLAAKKVVADKVVKLFVSKDGSRCRMMVYEKPVIGSVKAMSDKEVTIDKATYPLGLAYHSSGSGALLQTGETVSAFVDETGEVIWIERDVDAISGSWTIAFSQKYAKGSGLTASVCLRLFTIDAAWKELYVADKVYVDGVAKTKAEFGAMLEADKKDTAYNYLIGEMVRYQTDSNGNIKAIDTVEDNVKENDGTLHMQMHDEVASGLLYTTRSGAFWSGQTMVSLGAETTPIFVLPQVGGAYATDTAYDRYFSVQKLNNVISSHVQSQRAVRPYMKNEFGYPTFFITVNGYSENVGTSNYVSSDSASFMIVDNVVTTVNSDGALMLQATGHSTSKNTATENNTILIPLDMQMIETGVLYQEEKDTCFNSTNMVDAAKFEALPGKEAYIKSVADIAVGDVIRYQYSGNNMYAVERLFDFDPANPVLPGTLTAENGVWHASGNNTSAYSVYYRHQIGKFTKMDTKFFSVETLSGNTETYELSKFSKIYTLDTNGAKAKLKKITNIAQFEGTDSQVWIYSYNGSPYMMMIYPY